MDVTWAQCSEQGPVRKNNEDCLAFWAPEDPEERKRRGALAVIADGVGGQGDGEIASRLAVETVLTTFREAPLETPLSGLLWRMIDRANLAVYDAGMEQVSAKGRMATTLTAVIFRADQVAIGHVGDSRAYLVHGNHVQCLTTDHTYLAFHARMGLFAGAEPDSPLRGMLSRCVGKEPVVQIDYYYATVAPGDTIVLCTDGVHGLVSESDLLELTLHQPAAEACRNIAGLAAARGSEDNYSLLVVRVERTEQLTYYRGSPVYTEPETKMSHDLEVGELLDNRFEITEVLSRSGMATVFKAKDRQTGQWCALKVPFLEFESDPAFYSRFEREEAIGQLLEHPYIMRIIPVDPEVRSRPYIAMELLSGTTLNRVMQQTRPMPITEATFIIRRLCDAVEHMHSRDVIHRDLKPQNIMLCTDGSLRIIDFGIAKAGAMRRVTFTGFSPSMGTPDYMAPEQVKGKRGDRRTDVYSLGAMLYEMVTGHVPFDAANPFLVMHNRVVGDPVAPRKLNPEISLQLEEIILHAMARDPNDRYQTAAAMALNLAEPEKVEVTGRAQRLTSPNPWKARWRQLARIALLALVPVVIVAVLYLLFHHS